MGKTETEVFGFRLPDAEVGRLLNHLDDGESDVDDSKRRSARHALRGKAMVVFLSESGNADIGYSVRMRNISQHGLAFLTHRNMLPGTLIRIQLPMGTDRAVVQKRAVVRRCRHVQAMVFEIGAEFGADKPGSTQPGKRVGAGAPHSAGNRSAIPNVEKTGRGPRPSK
jgi:PilZ domain